MIKIQKLKKSFGQQLIFENLNFEILNGGCFFIVGKSGSGKSVLMKLITGLLPADSGEIWIDGIDVTTFNEVEWNQVRDKFGVVFQGAALFDSINVLQNTGIRLYEQQQLTDKQIKDYVVDALEKVGLDSSILYKLPSELSGGMRKRVGVARAIIHQPEYIFYDEPLAGLDPISSDIIDNLISDIAQKTQATSIIISHDMYSVKKLASSVVLIHDHKQHFYGSALNYLNANDEVIQAFLARKI